MDYFAIQLSQIEISVCSSAKNKTSLIIVSYFVK